MLLVRALLRANSVRRRVAHVFVFFIFVVSNAGGLLTPLGNPPLFLGFLRGVPFTWTLRLWREWAFVVAALLLVFYVVDSTVFRREDLATPGDLDELAVAHRVPLHIAGAHNVLWLAGVVVVLLASGTLAPPPGVTEAALVALAALAWFTTPAALRRENVFTWGPSSRWRAVRRDLRHDDPGARDPERTGGGARARAALGVLLGGGRALVGARQRAHLPHLRVGGERGRWNRRRRPLADRRPRARSRTGPRGLARRGAHGAGTYIGNGPNFMVKTIAEEGGVRMPSFFGYLAWSGPVLLPVFAAVTWLFLL